ncbi:MAG TPA: hypothetical protein DD379_24670 [Cyanobacteria bacterium UBA11162]|nr:hypothetical protein [Cyanobacteria bacterium UBA11162]
MFKLIFTVSASLIGVLTITSLPIYAQTNSSQPQFGLMRNIDLNYSDSNKSYLEPSNYVS